LHFLENLEFFQLPLSGSLGWRSGSANRQRLSARLSTPSLGITLFLKAINTETISFQLPLSGSLNIFYFPQFNKKWIRLSTPSLGITSAIRPSRRMGHQPEAFNSLSRDHSLVAFTVSDGAFLDTLSTPSLGITKITGGASADEGRAFQLPLSGSHDDTSRPNQSSISDLSTPSLGITGRCRGRRFFGRSDRLSTPSLGITELKAF